MKKLCIIDGYGFVFRAYHSLPPLSSPNHIPVSAVYGFVNMLTKVIKSHQYDLFAVALDTGVKNFRHDIYKEYKANRAEAPEDLKVQFPIIREAIEAFHIPIIEQVGYEADDLIASYVEIAKQHGYKITIITADKDLMSLMDDDVKLYDPIKNREITIDDVIKKFGVGPTQVIDALSLIGDASDNIKGVKGIGVKTAATLLNTYQSLENLYDNIQLVTPDRIQKLLIEQKDNAFLSKKLATLFSQVKAQYNVDELIIKEYDKRKLGAFFTKYGFKSLFHKFDINQSTLTQGSLENLISNTEQQDNINCYPTNIIHISQIEPLIQEIVKFGAISFHIQNMVFTFSFCEQLYKIEMQNENDAGRYESIKNILEALHDVLQDSSVKKIAINAKEIIHHCAKNNITLSDIEDISVMAYTIKMGKYKYDLESLANEYLNIPFQTTLDASTVFLLYKTLYNRIFQESKVELYESIDKPMLQIICQMEMLGVMVNKTILERLSDAFRAKLGELEDQIYKLTNKKFNIASPKQVGEILFAEPHSLSLHNIQENKKTKIAKKSKKTGHYIVDSNTLETLADSGNVIAPLILKWRGIFKLLTTYTDGMQAYIDPITSRIHTTLELTATATGRLSSKHPNLQNIPIKTKNGIKIREAFIAKDGYLLLSFDYSQIELRLLAHIAKIESLRLAFNSNDDIHTITASQIFNTPIHDVDQELRRKAKAVNFGIIYGISAFGLAKNLDISKSEAEKYIDEYFKKYPGILEYMQTTISWAKKNGFVYTAFGRKCHIDGINDSNYNTRQFAERAAINAPIQGTAADIIKKAMVMLPETVKQYMVLQIHDELLFEIPIERVNILAPIIKNVMENLITLSVPLLVECKSGKSWYNQEAISF